MANKLYPLALSRMWTTGLQVLTADVKVVAVDTAAYTYSDAHEFLSDIPGGARIATSGNMSSKTVAIVTSDDSRFDCDDFSMTFAAAQPTCEVLVYYVDTGVAGTSYLIKYTDTSPSLPLTPPPGGGIVSVTIAATGVGELRN